MHDELIFEVKNERVQQVNLGGWGLVGWAEIKNVMKLLERGSVVLHRKQAGLRTVSIIGEFTHS